MPLLKKTIMWGFFLAAMYFGGSMTQSGSNMLQGMGFMSILAALICLYLVMKLMWGPLSHLLKLVLIIGVVWFCAYSIGLFDGNTLQSFLSGTPAPVSGDVAPVSAVAPTELDALSEEMFGNGTSKETATGETAQEAPAQQTAEPQPVVQTQPMEQQPVYEDDGGLVGRIKTFLFGRQKKETVVPQRAFNPLEYPEIRGYPKVLSGSILALEGIKLKLFGIDAPDANQVCINRMNESYNCGVTAKEWLQEWLNGKEVSCHVLSKVERGWATASCFVDDNKYDVAAVIVNSGWAVAYPRTTDVYVPYERQAAGARRGLWSGTFYKPWDWRKLQNRKFKVKINYSKKKPSSSDSGGGFDFWGLF